MRMCVVSELVLQEQGPHGDDDVEQQQQGPVQQEEIVDEAADLAVGDGRPQTQLDEGTTDPLAVQGIAGHHVENHKSTG